LIYFFVGIGGIVGSLLRYLLSYLALNIWGEGFPIGTLMINISGAFLLGWFSNAIVIPKKIHPNLIAALSTGVIGSYTTYSTFCMETVQLIESENYLKGFIYVGFSLLGGLFFVRLGKKLAVKKIIERGTNND
jgi:CrcB protein